MATIQKVSGIDFANISKFDEVLISAVGSINFIGKPATGNLLLDTTYGSGAEAAYSVRKLRTAYTGPAMQVQDTAVGSTQDIYFDANNNIDEAAIVSYGGSNTVLVAKWYDQSGNGNDAIQNSSGSRPTIYTGGALVKENGKVAVDFDGDKFLQKSINWSPRSTFLFTQTNGTGGAQQNILRKGTNPTDRFIYRFNSTGTSYTASNQGYSNLNFSSTVETKYLFSNNLDGGTKTLRVNGVLTGTTSGTLGALTTDTLYIGNFSGESFNGIAQEISFYTSVKSDSDTTSIESNVGDYFTQNTPLLDTYTGAAAAYSLRRLSNSYVGSAIQVQRADNVGGTTDIGFNLFGELDTVSLAQVAAGNSMVVAVWYDQSGNGNNASQGSSLLRPKIYDGTTGVVTENGKPAVEFDGSDFVRYQTGFQAYTCNVVFRKISGSNNYNTVLGRDSQNDNAMFLQGNNSNDVFAPDMANVYQDGYAYATNNFLDINNQHNYFFYGTSAIATDDFYIGRRSNGFGMAMNCQEVVVWSGDESDNRTEIETNINTFYDIYTEPVAPLLLNNYPGAAAAYSLRRINSSYQGAAVLVQTTSNTKGPVYIGFDSNNDLDTVSLAAYGGSEEVVVAGWLDQSGNGNNAIQNSSGSRPKIYDGTTGVVTENGKPAVDFDGSNDFFSTLWSAGTTASMTAFNIASPTNNTTSAQLYDLRDANNDGLRLIMFSDSNLFMSADFDDLRTTPYNDGQQLIYSNYASSTIATGIDGGTVNSTSAPASTSVTSNAELFRDNSSSFYFLGKAQEAIFYLSNKSDYRTDIESNIGGYYDIPLAGLLDEYSGAAAGYSLRRLSNTYTGSAIQVQRADNVGGTTDIGFDSYGELDTAALTTVADGNSMVVAKWYDQSGNSNDASQGTSASRPKIYDGTTGVVLENGKPAIDLNISNASLYKSLTTIVTGDDFVVTGIAVAQVTNGSAGTGYVAGIRPLIAQGARDTYDLSFEDTQTATRYQGGNTVFNEGDGQNQSVFIAAHISTNSVSVGRLNGSDTTLSSSANITLNMNSNSGIVINGGNSASGYNNSIGTTNARVQEVVFYFSDKYTNDRIGIEENIGGYYDIPLAGLLDEYSGAATGYSLRRLSSTYTGSAVQVQRADNVGGTHEIGFDSYGELDLTALTTAAQGNSMVVAKWYDQSGNSNDAIQNSSGARPKIYDGTTGVVTRGGKPSVLFTGSTQILPISTSFNLNTYLYVGQPLGRSQAFGDAGKSVKTDALIGYRNFVFEWSSGSLYVLHNGTVYDATGGGNILVNLGFDVVLFRRGSVGTKTPDFIGRENTQYISELISYSTLESNSNLVGISNNANAFYSAF